MRCGGFQVTAYGRKSVKEIGKYRDNLKRFAEFGEFFRNTVIENLHYRDLIRLYGKNKDAVLFADPPYPGIKYDYYSIPFSKEDNFFLADQLLSTPAPVVCTFYDNEEVRRLYPEKYWQYETVRTTKNNGSQKYGHKKEKVDELILTKKVF
jgi:site-specific DNA-adenine methylase